MEHRIVSAFALLLWIIDADLEVWLHPAHDHDVSVLGSTITAMAGTPSAVDMAAPPTGLEH